MFVPSCMQLASWLRYASFSGCGVEKFHDCRTNPPFSALSCIFIGLFKPCPICVWLQDVIYLPNRPRLPGCLLLRPVLDDLSKTVRCLRARALHWHVSPATLSVLCLTFTTASTQDSRCSSAVSDSTEPLSNYSTPRILVRLVALRWA